jgi:hypothetical protein
VEKGLLECREQKHDRRVARQQAFLGGVARILNELGGGAAWHDVLHDEYLAYVVAMKPIKQSKPEGNQARHATRVGLEIKNGQAIVCQEDVQLGRTANSTPDDDKEVKPLDESAKKSMRAALKDYVTVYALAQQDF